MFNDFINWIIYEKAMFTMIIAYFIGSATNNLSGSFNNAIITPLINKFLNSKNNTEIKYELLISSTLLFIINLIIAYFISKLVMRYVKK